MSDMTTVWIVEDSSDYAEHLSNLLNLDEHLHCEESFASYDEARSFLRNARVPDVILLDLFHHHDLRILCRVVGGVEMCCYRLLCLKFLVSCPNSGC